VSPPILSVENLVVAYGRVEAVRGVSFHADAGSLVTLVGANGAGKTSILNAIAGLVRPRSGHVRYAGKDVTHRAAHRLVSDGLVQVPEGRLILGTLTVEENLQLGGWQRRSTQAASIEEMYQRFPLLAERRALVAGALSGGEQQMLVLARAMVAVPRVILIDELSTGLAPVVVQKILPVVRRIANEKRTAVILVEQHVHMALQVADRAIVLAHGDVVLERSAAELRRDPELLTESYLGRTA